MSTPVVKQPSTFDKTPMGSKKFIAYLLAEATWKLALLLVILMGMKNSSIDTIVGALVISIVIVAGFIEAGYILGQASLDRYTRIAEILVKGGHDVVVDAKGKVQMASKPPPVPTKQPPVNAPLAPPEDYDDLMKALESDPDSEDAG